VVFSKVLVVLVMAKLVEVACASVVLPVTARVEPAESAPEMFAAPLIVDEPVSASVVPVALENKVEPKSVVDPSCAPLVALSIPAWVVEPVVKSVVPVALANKVLPCSVVEARVDDTEEMRLVVDAVTAVIAVVEANGKIDATDDVAVKVGAVTVP
jgi:hypothetical protein